MLAPKLKTVGKDLNLAGVTDADFPVLENIGGNFVLIQTGMKSLPPKLKNICGDVIISDQEPKSFIESIKATKREGILKGNFFIMITYFQWNIINFNRRLCRC